MDYNELRTQRDALLIEAKATALSEAAEDAEKAVKMLADVRALDARLATLSELEGLATESKAGAPPRPSAPNAPGFKSLGDFLNSVWTLKRRQIFDPRLKTHVLYDEPVDGGGTGWVEQSQRKQLVENVGADGGFLVPIEYGPQFFMYSAFGRYVRERALVIQTNRREFRVPTLDQTGTTAGRTNLYGGVRLTWTEEAAEKEETQPAFRQLRLIMHKLAAVTNVSDELVADNAYELVPLLTRLFGEATMNEHDWTFINGTGAGQPLGVANPACGATIAVARAGAGAIDIADIFNMLTAFSGQSPIWLAHQSTMPQILGLNGPAGNPSYVWISNARDDAPSTLMGYPIFFIENCPTLGQRGDIILADWSKYVIGERQAVTIDSSIHYQFPDDITMWRCVSRIDGRPWLSAPLTLRDGASQVSPFVVLDAEAT